MINQDFTLSRDCPATLIPNGDTVVLESGTPVTITQALGGSVTVRNSIGMFRVAQEDADALGPEVVTLLAQMVEEDRMAAEAKTGPVEEDTIWEILKTCYDPEIPVNIVDLGLIYDLRLEPASTDEYDVFVKMTLTAQGCGMGPTIAADAAQKIKTLPAVREAAVDIVWEPVWNPRMISEEGRKKLGLE